jgi:hypothetical protein
MTEFKVGDKVKVTSGMYRGSIVGVAEVITFETQEQINQVKQAFQERGISLPQPIMIGDKHYKCDSGKPSPSNTQTRTFFAAELIPYERKIPKKVLQHRQMRRLVLNGISKRNVDDVKNALDQGYDPNRVEIQTGNVRGRVNALHYAVMEFLSRPNKKIVDIIVCLLERGANPHLGSQATAISPSLSVVGMFEERDRDSYDVAHIITLQNAFRLSGEARRPGYVAKSSSQLQPD